MRLLMDIQSNNITNKEHGINNRLQSANFAKSSDRRHKAYRPFKFSRFECFLQNKQLGLRK